MTYVEGAPAAPGEVQDPAAFEPERPEAPVERRTLGELVPQEVVGPLVETLNAAIDGRMRAEDAVRMITEILDPHRDYIEERGSIPEYLAAYLVSAHIGKEVEAEPSPPPKKRRKKR